MPNTGRGTKWGSVAGFADAHLDTVIHLIGLGVGVGLYRAISARMRPFDEAFHEGREVGYNRGYGEGRRAGRPVLVPLECPDCGHQLERRTG